MSEQDQRIIVPDIETSRRESHVILPDNKILVLGGTIEKSLNALRNIHVETAKALTRTIAAQHALQETMDTVVPLLRDPNKSVEDAVRELTKLLDLQKKLEKERENLEVSYTEQKAEYERINLEMERLAKHQPHLFNLASNPAEA